MRHLLIGLALLASAQAPARTLGSLDFEPCTLAPDYAPQAVEAQCATLSVPENRAAPDGRRIDLAIAWVPASAEAAPDPVFMLAGGPGQSARDSYPTAAAAFADARKQRHVILVDQRGTGASNPLLCADAAGQSAVIEGVDETPEAARAFADKCRAALEPKADLRFYTTTDAVHDLDAVRAAIGAETINLVGISYGTRVAQQYARRYPQHTRTLTLDSVVPNELLLGNEHAKNLEAALDLHFARCAQTPVCRDAFGAPRDTLKSVLAQAEAGQTRVSYRDPLTAQRHTDALTRGHVVNLLRLFSYAPAAAAMLPLTLHEAAQGRFEPLMAQARMIVGQISEQIMHGMQLSVLCTEDAPQMRADADDADTLLGTEFLVFTQAQCAAWPRGEAPDDFHTPLTGAVPALLLSGEYDPVTPPRYGAQVLAHLVNGRHLVLPGQGHSVLGIGCTPKLFARFLDTADAKALDARCLDKLPYAPPFAGYYGWEP